MAGGYTGNEPPKWLDHESVIAPGDISLWATYSDRPSPLYLNKEVVFVKPSLVYTAGGVLPATVGWPGFDPLRPAIGHWKTPKTKSGLWWDTTNNLINTIGTSHYSPFGRPGHRRFVLPSEQAYEVTYYSSGDSDPNSAKNVGNNPPEIGYEHNFRFLATNTVTVEVTKATDKWEEAYNYYNSEYLAEGTGNTQEPDESGFYGMATPDNPGTSTKEAKAQELKGLLFAAIASGPMPHSHEGLINKDGVGFTISMHIEPKYQALWKVMLGLGASIGGKYDADAAEQQGIDFTKSAMPQYHTHKLLSTGIVNNFAHKNYIPAGQNFPHKKHTGVFEHVGMFDHGEIRSKYGQHEKAYQVGWKMDHWKWIEDKNNNPDEPGGLTFFEWTTIDEGAVTSPIFLEFMQLYYNNKELEEIIRLVQEDGKDGFVPSLDEKPDDPYFISKFTSDPADDKPESEEEVNKKYHHKLRKLKKHLIDRYLSNMQHTPSYSYKTLSAHKVFQDKVFTPRTFVNGSLGSRESVYNYTKPYYEEALNLLSQHKLIPNPYLIGQLREDPARFGETMEGSQPGLFSPEYHSMLDVGTGEIATNLFLGKNEFNINTWLRNWSKAIVEKSGQYDIVGINENAVMGFPRYDFIKKYNPAVSYLYPWYAKLLINVPSPLSSNSSAFPSNREPFINKVFVPLNKDEDAKDDRLMLFFMAKVANKDSSTSYSVGEQHYEQDFYVRGENSFEERKIETFNFTDWLSGDVGMEAFGDYVVKTDNLISFDLGVEEKDLFQNTQWEIEDAFIRFKDKVEKFENTRSVYEILDAKNTPELNQYGYDMHPFAHNEIMFYEIEKHSTDSLLPEKLIQKYFIAPPQEDKQNVIEFIDSQMKIEKGYHYKVNVYVLVVGNKYQYVDIQTKGLELIKRSLFKGVDVHPGQEPLNIQQFEGLPNSDVPDSRDGPTGEFGGDQSENATLTEHEDHDYRIKPVEDRSGFTPIADIFVINKPIIELLKIPYTSFQTVYVANKPPLFPNVVIYPYKNINNKVLFTLGQYAGKRTEIPIEILPGDKDTFMKAALAQEKIDADDLELPPTLDFQSDEPDLKYQVFRIEEHPESWSDFAAGLHEPILDDKGNPRQLIEYEKDFVDSISPNKKYYYTFRTVDSRGFISNPSPIYQVELIDDSGAVYLVSKKAT